MRMRFITVAAIVISMLVIATAAVAQSPFVGTWKLNLDKSNFIVGAPLGWTDVFREIEGDQYEVKSEIALPDGSIINEVMVWPRQGGVAAFIQGGAEGVTDVETVISPNEMFVTRMVDKKQSGLIKLLVSPNGKIIRYTIKFPGVMEGEALFDKQ